jgi:acetylornithine deacetylase
VNLIELAKKLVNIPSVTGSEAEIAGFLSSYLRNKGFELEEQKVEGKRRNIFAKLHPGPKVILCTHLDTVPPFYGAREDESFIYGRGACDAKGIIACMILAAQELSREGVKEIGLLFVVGEETDSIGAKTAGSLSVDSEYVIVGEPTENKMGSGHKGIVNLKISAEGKSAHSAFPDLGESAVEKLLDVLQEIRALDFREDPILGKTVINIGKIEGGLAFNVIADSASAEVSFRSGLSSEEIIGAVKAVAGRRARIDVVSQSEPQFLFTVPGFEQVVLPYGTDIPYLQKFGKPLLLGPGSALVAHTENERVEKEQLFDAVEIYKKIVKILLGH